MTETWIKIGAGLVLFAIGLKLFGGALKTLADPGWLTAMDNPWTMAVVCLGLTLVVQSSSLTTSLLIAVVASGHLSMAAAVGGIVGANLGTTLTAWIAAAVFGMEASAKHAAMIHTLLNLGLAAVALPLARPIAALVSKL